VKGDRDIILFIWAAEVRMVAVGFRSSAVPGARSRGLVICNLHKTSMEKESNVEDLQTLKPV
jgi:hypothetical protein